MERLGDMDDMNKRGYRLIKTCSIGLLIYTAVYGMLMGLTMQAMTGSYLKFLVCAQLSTCVYAIFVMGIMVELTLTPRRPLKWTGRVVHATR